MNADDIAAQYPRAAWAHGRAQTIADEWANLHYDSERHAQHSYHGHELWKTGDDLMLYAELIHRVRPTLIIESGTFLSGSALFFAHQLDALYGPLEDLATDALADVLTIDVEERGRAAHPRIDYRLGSSVSEETVAYAAEAAEAFGGPVFVSLDSNHERPHVLAELDAYAPLVTPGSYMVVEDTNLNGHPVLPTFGPGPWEAVEQWLPDHPEFERDDTCERFLWTANTWLRRVG